MTKMRFRKNYGAPTNKNLLDNEETIVARYLAMAYIDDVAKEFDVPPGTLRGYFRRQIQRGSLVRRQPIKKRWKKKLPQKRYTHKANVKKPPRCARCKIRLDFYDHPNDNQRVPKGKDGLCGWCLSPSLWELTRSIDR